MEVLMAKCEKCALRKTCTLEERYFSSCQYRCPEHEEPVVTKIKNFDGCVKVCLKNAEFVRQFDRLHKTNVQRRGSAIELMVDDATGRTKADMQCFRKFVRTYIWTPLFTESKKRKRR